MRYRMRVLHTGTGIEQVEWVEAPDQATAQRLLAARGWAVGPCEAVIDLPRGRRLFAPLILGSILGIGLIAGTITLLAAALAPKQRLPSVPTTMENMPGGQEAEHTTLPPPVPKTLKELGSRAPMKFVKDGLPDYWRGHIVLVPGDDIGNGVAFEGFRCQVRPAPTGTLIAGDVYWINMTGDVGREDLTLIVVDQNDQVLAVRENVRVWLWKSENLQHVVSDEFDEHFSFSPERVVGCYLAIPIKGAE